MVLLAKRSCYWPQPLVHTQKACSIVGHTQHPVSHLKQVDFVIGIGTHTST